MLSSPYTWLEALTPKDKWLGGIKYADKDVRTIDALREYLTASSSAQFEEALAPESIAFVLRRNPYVYLN